MLLVGLGRLARHERRREIVISLLTLVWVFNVLCVLVLVFSLVSPSGVHLTGRQLLFSGGAVWLTDAIAFGLAFWELDCGGPVARALAAARAKPDFQFPHDEHPQLARAAGRHAYVITSVCRLPTRSRSARPTRCLSRAGASGRQGPASMK